MSVMNPNEGSRSWRHYSRTRPVQLYVSDTDGRAGALVGEEVAGFALSVHPCDVTAEIDAAGLRSAVAAIVEVSADRPESVQRFITLAHATRTPLIAAVYEAPLALVRTLIRGGAHDVIPLPIDLAEVQVAVAPLRDRLQESAQSAELGKLVTVIKGSGGVGATSLLSQLAIRHAELHPDRRTCLIDLDVQFGDAAFQLGLRPTLSLTDLLDAGKRLDGELLRATTTAHPSGLEVIAAPADVMPLEALSSDQIIDIVDLATSEYGTVFLDLPTNWANWSLSLLARSDIILLITGTSVPSLRQTRRQLDLIRSLDLADIDLRVVANRCETGLFKKNRLADARTALGRDVTYTVTADDEVMGVAVDQGVPIAEVKRRSAVGRDIDQLEKDLAGSLGLES